MHNSGKLDLLIPRHCGKYQESIPLPQPPETAQRDSKPGLPVPSDRAQEPRKLPFSARRGQARHRACSHLPCCHLHTFRYLLSVNREAFLTFPPSTPEAGESLGNSTEAGLVRTWDWHPAQQGGFPGSLGPARHAPGSRHRLF